MLVRSGIREIKGEPIHVGKKYIASICSEVKVSMAELSSATLRQSVRVTDEPLATWQEHHSSPRQLYRLGAAIDQVRTNPVFERLDATVESRLGMVEYTTPIEAYRGSWYRGIEHLAARALRLPAKDFFEIQRAIRFIG